MRTEELINRLSTDLAPVPRCAASLRLALGLAVGAGASLLLLFAWLGVRPDLAEAARSGGLWIKFAFTLSLGAAAFATLDRLSRPGGRVGAGWFWLVAPLAVVSLLAIVQFLEAPGAYHEQLWTGRSAVLCPVRIAALAAPVFAALLWAFRRLAPTRLAPAGFAAGILAGCVGAAVYALYCPEDGAGFLAVWYTLGVFTAGLMGALIGSRLLRW